MIPSDKFGHAVMGGLIGGIAAAAAFLACWALKIAPAWMAPLALIAAAAAGAAREAYALITGNGTAEWSDFWSTACGGSLVAIGLSWGGPMAVFYVVVFIVTLVAAIESARRRAQRVAGAAIETGRVETSGAGGAGPVLPK